MKTISTRILFASLFFSATVPFVMKAEKDSDVAKVKP